MWVGAGLVGLMLVIALLTEVLAPYQPNEPHDQFLPPSSSHWLGTDVNRHDVLSRVMYGSRLSLLAGGISILLAVLVGAPIGTLAGFIGGRFDAFVMRTIDVILTFPSILIALLVAMAFSRGWFAVIVSVGLINIPVFARQMRAAALTIRQQDYIEASRALGAAPAQILWHGVLPGLISPIIVLATLGLGSAILEVAALSFLGVGGDPTEPEWGAMLAQSKNFLSQSIWPALGPGGAISLSILGFNLLGDGLRDALDPKINVR